MKGIYLIFLYSKIFLINNQFYRDLRCTMFNGKIRLCSHQYRKSSSNSNTAFSSQPPSCQWFLVFLFKRRERRREEEKKRREEKKRKKLNLLFFLADALVEKNIIQDLQPPCFDYFLNICSAVRRK